MGNGRKAAFRYPGVKATGMQRKDSQPPDGRGIPTARPQHLRMRKSRRGRRY